MFERPRGGQQAVLVHLEFPGTHYAEAQREFTELATSAGAEVSAMLGGRREVPDAKYFAGSGKVAEVAAAVVANQAELVVFNHDLSPSQERNLEKFLQCRVLDRTGLILDIFAQRARSHEGKLQVELAQLQHLATRLVRGWSHLERQKGGIGLRGPGETQLETDRRLVGARIKRLKDRLEKVRRQRSTSGSARRKAEIPAVSVVGYTNAGKSTLFNQLTGAHSFVADQLFATLDPTLRRLPLGAGENLILADTVGFIRDLPHDLVEAFHATLEETRQAHLLLHVVDAADPERMECIRQVQAVLDEIGASDVQQIEVFNKIDLIKDAQPRLERDEAGRVRRVHVSAATGAGLDLLRAALEERFFPDIEERELSVPANAGRLRARLFALGAVQHESTDDDGASRLRIA
ncbi:MAG: ribosome rescue GTPase HflX, partial [Nevskiales bacterium]